MNSEYLLRALLRNLVLPPCGPLLLILAGWLLRGRARRAAWALFWVGALSLWWLSTPVVADRLAAITERKPALDLSTPSGAGAIVILSAGARDVAPEYGAAAPDEETLVRLAYGAYVARRTGLPILVSGGGFNATLPLATVMRRSLEQDFRLPVQWSETTSRDTHENAVNSAALLRTARVQRVILVTAASHMARAAAEFRAAGLEVVPAPADINTPRAPGLLRWLPGPKALERSQRVLYELLGELVRRVAHPFTTA